MVNLRLNISDELNAWIKQKASQSNTSPSRFVLQTAFAAWGEKAITEGPTLDPTRDKEENEKKRSKRKDKEEKENQYTKQSARAREFEIPSLAECTAYCQTLSPNDTVLAREFHDFYSASGWKFRNGVRVNDWKAAMRTWVRRQKRELERPSGSPKEREALANRQKQEAQRQRARLVTGADPVNWGLCAERCGNYVGERCVKGAKWPPHMNDWPIPPEQCRKFTPRKEEA